MANERPHDADLKIPHHHRDLGWALREVLWASGFLEGEGSFGNSPRTGAVVEASQVQRQPLERLHRVFGGSLLGPYLKKTQPNAQAYYRWQIFGAPAIGIMMTLYVEMSPARQEQIRAALDRWKAAPGSRAVQQRAKVACPKGHPYDYTDVNGHRVCRRCRGASVKAWRTANPEKARAMSRENQMAWRTANPERWREITRASVGRRRARLKPAA
jgi:hypothetical protein